jgi:hypothetical protein
MKNTRNLIYSIFIIYFNFVFVTDCFSRTTIARVVKIRGNVTQLAPGAQSAFRVKLNDKIVADTSLVTGRKSFVKLKFHDGTNLSLGPKGKIVVLEMKTKGTGVISLLKGKLRSQVIKNKKSSKENKFFIQTRTAAMGVRGTDFETIYNPDNKITSLITFTGNVAMAKIKEDPALQVKKEKENRRRSRLGKRPIKLIPRKSIHQLNEILKSKDTVEVRPGQYAGAVPKMAKASKPVKLSPVQLNILFKNTDMKEKVAGDEKSAMNDSEIAKETDLEDIIQAEQTAPPEGFFDKETGDYAPMSGGFVDLKTGIYVPPPKDAVFDKKKRIYVAKKIGSIDKQTGQYYAPKGIELDASRGFVARVDSDMSGNQKELLVAKANTMNDIILKEEVIGDPEDLVLARTHYRQLNNRQIFKKDTLSLDIDYFNQNAESEKSVTDGNRKIKSDNGQAFLLTWGHASHTTWQLVTTAGLRRVDYNKDLDSDIAQASEKLVKMSAGVRWYMGTRWNMLAQIMLDQEHFIKFSTNSTSLLREGNLIRVTLPKIRVGAEWKIFRSGRWSIDSDLGLILTRRKTTGDMVVSNGVGADFSLGTRYWASPSYWLQAGLFTRYQNQDASAPGLETVNKRTDFGLRVKLGTTF